MPLAGLFDNGEALGNGQYVALDGIAYIWDRIGEGLRPCRFWLNLVQRMEKPMTKLKFKCKCGAEYTNRRHLLEHIGICNPKWPRSTPEDEHGEVKSK